MIVSPCISICKTDPTTGYCYGCGRNNDDKKKWKLEETTDEWKKLNLKVSPPWRNGESWPPKRRSNGGNDAGGRQGGDDKGGRKKGKRRDREKEGAAHDEEKDDNDTNNNN